MRGGSSPVSRCVLSKRLTRPPWRSRRSGPWRRERSGPPGRSSSRVTRPSPFVSSFRRLADAASISAAESSPFRSRSSTRSRGSPPPGRLGASRPRRSSPRPLPPRESSRPRESGLLRPPRRGGRISSLVRRPSPLPSSLANACDAFSISSDDRSPSRSASRRRMNGPPR